MAFEVNLETIVDQLEDINFDSYSERSKDYQTIKAAFDVKGSINVNCIDRLMVIIEKDLKKKDTRIISALSVLTSIVDKVKKGECTPQPDLLPSATSILNEINDMANVNSIETVKQLLFSTLSCYPDNVLVQAYISSPGLVKNVVLNYAYVKKIMQNKELPVQFFLRLLKILSPEERNKFVGDNIDFWFFKVIPKTMEIAITEGPFLQAYVEAAEILTETLVQFDYENHPAWLSVFSCIYNPNNYPSSLKKMIERSQEHWDRLWIIFVKLLKEDITRQKQQGRSPINALLPVVELAYKMMPADRCRAFKCWNVLINNFSKEKNEYQVKKRVKLLVIPLKSHNAKTECIAVAKLNTWWHLIRSFEDRLEKFIDLIVIPFLHFCHGKHDGNLSGKTLFCLAQFSDDAVKKSCLDMFVEIAGHVNCEGCSKVPRLKNRIISLKLLVDYWNDWVYFLFSAIKMAGHVNDDAMKQSVSCMWKSFLLTICELPPNNIRKDLFNDLLKIVEKLPKETPVNNSFADITMSVLIKSLFEEDQIKELLKTKDANTGPLNTIFSVILDPCLNDFYKRKKFLEVVSLLKPITNFIVTESQCPCRISILGWNVKGLMPNDNTFMLWTALVESICELDSGSATGFNFSNLLLWPMKNMTLFSNASAEFAWYRWHTLYDFMRMKVNGPCIDSELLNILSVHDETTDAPVYLQLIAALSLLKQNLANGKGSRYEKPAELIINILGNEHNLRHVEKMIPVIVDVLFLFMSKVTDTKDVVLARFALTAVKAMMSSAIKLLQLPIDNAHYDYMRLLENLVKNVDTMFKVNALFTLKDIILDELIECSNKVPSVKDIVHTLLTALLSKCEQNDPVYEKIKTAIDPVANNNDNFKPVEQESDKCNFTAPDMKAKQFRKKEPNIVNTVVENGEEYVVVKSNWKFNPKKLTKNQIEKLKKKREDIPALYQDLSQSQDEFKISAWKADSQDTSTTSSKSASNSASEDVSTILTNMPSSEVVPKIMQTILSDAAKETIAKTGEYICSDSSPKQAPASKDAKTPRLALKDRVFRNVRNLMEKSGLRNEIEISVELNKTIGDNNKTPNAMIRLGGLDITSSVVHSAPPKISSERPSRVIKKPKKFEDADIFGIKKQRPRLNSLSETPDPSSGPLPEVQLNHCEIKKEIDHSEYNEYMHMSTSTTSNEKEINIVEKQKLSDTTATENVPLNAVKSENTLEKSKLTTDLTCTNKKNDVKMDVDVDTNVLDIENTIMKEDIVPIQDVVEASKKIGTPKSTMKRKEDEKSSVKKKISLIKKQLMIDMVEGHPLLQARSEERLTRKIKSSPRTVIKRKSLAEKMNKLDSKNVSKSDKKTKEKVSSTSTREPTVTSVTVVESQDRLSGSSEDMPASEDIIESSQDSSITTISVKSAKKACVLKLSKSKEIKSLFKSSETQNLLNDSNDQIISLSDTAPPQPINITASPPSNKIPVVVLDKSKDILKYIKTSDTQKILDDFNNEIMPLNDSVCPQHETNDDISLPKNKTMLDDKTELELTENMDTQPFVDKSGSSSVIIINNDEAPITISHTEELPNVGLETQEIAEVDTQLINLDSQILDTGSKNADSTKIENKKLKHDKSKVTTVIEEDVTLVVSGTDEAPLIVPNNACSPLKDATQKNKDFLNDTIEISPIKTLSPVREEKSPSTETSSDYVVIKLTSPVHSNGEPFNEKPDSPEIFTEEKVSPDKRDQSPPRIEVTVTNTSPSSSLSMKKNRPQMRPSGRAAQMLGLCAPDKLQAIMNSDRSVETEEAKKNSNPIQCTPARRNLRKFYNSVGDSDNQIESDHQVCESEQELSENFLKFQRNLPSAHSSPVGPILKRKLADIADDATISPASKRKRVSFHDPPVSTMVSIQKYIEPLHGIRSPQSLKRQGKQLLAHNLKSPKRLDNVFKLDTVLTKAVESFSDDNITMVSNDTEMSSIDQTPAVEVVNTSELNDIDPICLDLLDCKDPIVEIAGELSSPAMKDLLIKELKDRVETVADLAKMTELEVNRLCIKVPKVKIVRKVLADYVAKRSLVAKASKNADQTEKNTMEHEEASHKIIDFTVDVQINTNKNHGLNVEVQTNRIVTSDADMQTDMVPEPVVRLVHTQTDVTPVVETSVQTIESRYTPTKDIIASYLLERSDFVEELTKQLEESSLRQIAEKLPTNTVMDVLTKKITASDTTVLSSVRDNLCEMFDSKDLILFCSDLLQRVHDKST